MKIKHLILVMCLAAFCKVQAQDFHNSFFQFAPANISPTLTGAFYGNIRASVIGRDQGRAISTNREWQDLSGAIDYNIDFGFTDGDWISVGANIARSQVGEADFTRQYAGLSGAYHLAFGKKGDKVFTLGVKYGDYSTRFRGRTTENLVSSHRLSTGNIGGDIENLVSGAQNMAMRSSNDYALGLMLDLPISKTADIRFGIASDHIFNPRLRSTNSGPTTNPTPEPNPNPNPPIGNSFVRLERRFNAFIFLYTDVLSYDTNVGGLRPATGTFGALELGISKIFNWSKKPVVKPKFICPRL